ncbi:hypothetical protein ACQJBY_034910 [Aegilops geniculata]
MAALLTFFIVVAPGKLQQWTAGTHGPKMLQPAQDFGTGSASSCNRFGQSCIWRGAVQERWPCRATMGGARCWNRLGREPQP